MKHSLSVQVGLSGLEPPTSRLSGVRSNRLSYKPSFKDIRLTSFDEQLKNLNSTFAFFARSY